MFMFIYKIRNDYKCSVIRNIKVSARKQQIESSGLISQGTYDLSVIY